MKRITSAAFGILIMLNPAAPSFAEPPDADAELRFLGSIQWDCDDRIAFNGPEGGLHDTSSALRVTFDDSWRFTGIFRTSLPYGSGLYSQQYDIAGYAFDEDGKRGIMIDTFIIGERATLPDGIDWRNMKLAIYYIRLEDNAMGLDGVWEDTSGGRGRSECG